MIRIPADFMTVQTFFYKYRNPLILGGLAGTLISLDAFMASYLHLMHFSDLFPPYLLSFVIFSLGIGFIIGIIVTVNNLARIWQKKEAVFAIVLIISSQVKGLTSIGFLDFSDLVIFIFLIILLVENFNNLQYKIIVTPLFVLTLILIFAIVLSYTNEVSATKSSIVSLIGPIKSLLTILLILNLIRGKKDALFSLKAFIIVTLFSGIIGAAESLLYLFTGIGFHTNKFDFEHTPFGLFLRSQAFFGHIHGLAATLTLALAILFFILLAHRINIFWKKRTVMLLFVITFIALVFTFYKASLIAFGLIFIIGIFIRKPSYFIHITMGLLLIIILVYLSGLGDYVVESISRQLYTGDFKSRLELDKAGIEGFLHEHPIVGAGMGNNRIYTPHPSAWPAHNAFIQVADEIGVIGLISYCLIYVYLFYRLIITNFLLKDKKDRIIIQSLLLSLIAFFTIAQFEPLAYNFWFWMYFGLLECIAYNLMEAQYAQRPLIERSYA